MRGEVPTIRPIVPTPGGDAEWFAQSVEYYADNPDEHRDRAQSGAIGSGQETWMQTTVVGPGNISFYYKMSSVSGDGLAFYIDTNLAATWSQGSSWPWTGNFAVPSGTHTLKWKYYKYSGSTAGSCWIDAIQWTGGVPASGGGADWEQITYTYDPSGRRIAKDVDGVVTKYVAACPELAERDGDQCIAEYDANDVLLRKYIHGPCIDEPICMIEAAGGYAGTYYYHFDALGSVVALSDADGDTVQVYEYDVYGQVAASDPNHPNRFLFTGREFDTETGLYYYRARYYNASIGRFLQTDPIGYGDGINWYRYCTNNPIRFVDPSGRGLLEDIWGTYVQARDEFIAAWNLYVEAAKLAVQEYREAHPVADAVIDGAIDGLAIVNDGVSFYMWVPREVMDPIYEKYNGFIEAKVAAGLGTLSSISVGTGLLIHIGPIVMGSVEQIVEKLTDGSGIKTAVNWFPWDKPDKVEHIFRLARGHVNATTIAERLKWAQIFEQVANNEDYFIGYKMVSTADGLVNTGVKYYSAVIDGMKVWVEVYGTMITNAGVNGNLSNIAP